MSALFGFIIMLAAVAWVIAPLFRSRPRMAASSGNATALTMEDLLYQKKVAADIIQDLHFDFQTGKLSPEDHGELVQEQEKLLANIDERLARIQDKQKRKGTSPSGTLTGLILCMLISLPAVTGATQNATFSGRILNGSRDSSRVANVEVTLQLFRAAEHAPVDIARARSSAAGNFAFAIAAPDTGAVYLASTEHQGVRYYTDQADFAHARSAEMDIVLFDSTQSARDISVLMHHLIIQDNGESLSLRETRVLNNPTLKTILNVISDGHEQGAIMRIDLPPWAQNITPVASQFGNELHIHENVIYDAGVFEPGNRQISFAYDLPWQRNIATLVVQVYQATRSLDFFISDQGLTLEGHGLTNYGPFNIRGTTYQRYGMEAVPAGTRLQLQAIRMAPGAEPLSPWLTLIATGTLLLLGVALAQFRNTKTKSGKK